MLVIFLGKFKFVESTNDVILHVHPRTLSVK